MATKSKDNKDKKPAAKGSKNSSIGSTSGQEAAGTPDKKVTKKAKASPAVEQPADQPAVMPDTPAHEPPAAPETPADTGSGTETTAAEPAGSTFGETATFSDPPPAAPTVNLKKILNEPTEKKDAPVIKMYPDDKPGTEPPAAEEEQQDFKDDFKDLDWQIEEPEPGEDPDEEGPKEPDSPELTESELAEFYVEFYSDLQSSIFNPIYKKKRIPDSEEYQKAREMHKKIAAGQTDVIKTKDDKTLVKSYIDLQKELAKLPFSKDEKKRLSKPLAVCLKKWGKSLPPELILLMAFGQVTVSRVAPLMMAG